MLISILLPKTAKLIQTNDRAAIQNYAIKGTRITTILMALFAFPVILSASEILQLYMGPEHTNLTAWLSLWTFNVLIAGHNVPVATMVLATGQTKVLVISSAISFVISIITNILLVNTFQVGSAVISHSSYLIIQISFYYFYFNNKILRIKSLPVFLSFIYLSFFS